MKYEGSCHCGNVAFDVEGDLTGVMDCNCSICSRKGWLMWFVPIANFHLRTPDDNAGTYLFNRHMIKHRFCKTCGIDPYSIGADRQGNAMAAINVRCLKDVDIASLPVKHFDGKSL